MNKFHAVNLRLMKTASKFKEITPKVDFIKQDVFRLWSTVIEYKFGLFSSASAIEGFVN